LEKRENEGCESKSGNRIWLAVCCQIFWQSRHFEAVECQRVMKKSEEIFLIR
jgi:hypothetical protein